MKVVCISVKWVEHVDRVKKIELKSASLTLGKIYDVNINLEFIYQIIDDNGQFKWYSEDVLMPLEKYRELKLKELGI